jgi:hypothetical protein
MTSAAGTTPRPILFIVVGTLAFMSLAGLSIIGVCAVWKVAAAPEITTALITITTGALASLSALLVNTRHSDPADPVQTEISTAPETTVSLTPAKKKP